MTLEQILITTYCLTAGLMAPMVYKNRSFSGLLVVAFCFINIFFHPLFMFLADVNNMSLEVIYSFQSIFFAFLCLWCDKSTQSVAHAKLFAASVIANIMLLIDVHNLLGRNVTLIYPIWEYVIALITLGHIGAAFNGISASSRADRRSNKSDIFDIFTPKKFKRNQKAI